MISEIEDKIYEWLMECDIVSKQTSFSSLRKALVKSFNLFEVRGSHKLFQRSELKFNLSCHC